MSEKEPKYAELDAGHNDLLDTVTAEEIYGLTLEEYRIYKSFDDKKQAKEKEEFLRKHTREPLFRK